MTFLFRILITTVAFSLFANAAPQGICLHAYSPEAPADKIECFEFVKHERTSSGYRFFLNDNRTTNVTSYRFRGMQSYNDGLTPGNPEFGRLLKIYEETSRATPSTRPYLNPRILSMRKMAEGYAEEKQRTESLPKITIKEVEYLSPAFKNIEDGKLVMIHKDGFVKVDVDDFNDQQIQNLKKIDPRAGGIKVVEVSEKRLWNPRYEGISEGKIKVVHEKGTLSLDVDSVSEADIQKLTQLDPKFGKNKVVSIAGKKLWNPSFDGVSATDVKIKHEKGDLLLPIDDIDPTDKKTIMAWSDGSWKIAKPGFYDPKEGSDSYGELVTENGHFYPEVKLENRVGESISVKTYGASIEFPISLLGNLPGISSSDAARMRAWTTEIIDERLSRATPKSSTQVLGFVDAEIIRVTGIRVKILQVLDEGVLASKFVGTLHKGTETVQTTKTVTVENPVTGEEISKVVDTSTDDFEVTEDVTDDLCYIVGNTSNLVDGEIVKADSMRLLGRYQYTDVRGAKRSVRKYHVD